MGSNISYEINYIVTWDMALARWNVTTATKDYGYAECEYWLLRNLNKEDQIEICTLIG
jgi:hypothetical protein